MTDPIPTHSAGSVVCRTPTPADAAGVRILIDECKPLDVNSTYAYLLLCSHFAATCVVAESGGALVGFVSGYRKPGDDATLFVWQVAVSPRARGQKVGSRMLDDLIGRSGCHTVRWVETTISPGNDASWALFESFAKKRSAKCVRETLFLPTDFGAETHEEEQLLRIGPLRRTQ